MDYCSSCRRHVNGAYSCPGCGATAAGAHTATRVLEEPPFHLTGSLQTLRYEAPASHAPAEPPETAASDDPAPARPAPRQAGRAAGRQRQIRRRRRRGALVATAAGVVVTGFAAAVLSSGTLGGLVTQADREPRDKAGAPDSSAPETPTARTQQGPASRGGTAARPAASVSTHASGPPSASASASPSPSATGTRAATQSATRTANHRPSSTPTTTAPAPTSTTGSTSSSPSPSPKPSATCHTTFLDWCVG